MATTEGEFLTVVKDNETGLLVQSNNASQLADAIIWYLEHPQKAEQFSKAGKMDVERRLSWDNIAEEVVKAYKDVVCK